MKTKTWPTVAARTRMMNGVTKTDYRINIGKVPGWAEREFRSTKEEADARAREIRNEYDSVGVQAFALTSEQRLIAARTFARLPAGVTLDQVMDDWLARNKQSLIPMTVVALYDQLLTSTQHLRPRSRGTIRALLGSFVKTCPGALVAEITKSQIEQWIDSRKPCSEWTIKNNIVYLNQFFNFAIEKEVIAESPMLKIKKPARLSITDPGILTVENVQKLLTKAEDSKEAVKIVPMLAIGFFAGVRTAELFRLSWEDVQFENRLIRVGREAAKTRNKRFVTIEDNLLEWLMKYRQPSGPLGVQQKAFGLHRQRLCKEVGIGDWVENGMRHSFATYHLARGEDAAKTAYQMGHTQGPTLLYNHYRALVTKRDAELYWIIRPKAVDSVTVQSA